MEGLLLLLLLLHWRLELMHPILMPMSFPAELQLGDLWKVFTDEVGKVRTTGDNTSISKWGHHHHHKALSNLLQTMIQYLRWTPKNPLQTRNPIQIHLDYFLDFCSIFTGHSLESTCPDHQTRVPPYLNRDTKCTINLITYQEPLPPSPMIHFNHVVYF